MTSNKPTLEIRVGVIVKPNHAPSSSGNSILNISLCPYTEFCLVAGKTQLTAPYKGPVGPSHIEKCVHFSTNI